jgi:two-component system, cell cycle sensor histidine kinase and response regulator CckA
MNRTKALPMNESGCAELLAGASDGSAERGRPQKLLPAAEGAKALTEKMGVYIRGERRNRSAVDLCASVAEAMKIVRGSLGAGIELQPQLPSRPVHVMAEAIELQQMVLHLCSSAARAIAERGTIGVILKCVEASTEGSFPRAMLAPGRYALLKVKDTGCGMYAVRALPEVQALVTDLGGAMEVAAKPGLGTMFTIWLPAAESSPG